ncbi:MAG: tetratricopeptide repeat protein [bacterium]
MSTFYPPGDELPPDHASDDPSLPGDDPIGSDSDAAIAAIQDLYASAREALSRDKYVQARAELEIALGLLRSVPRTPTRAHAEAALLAALGIPVQRLDGYAHTAIHDIYTRLKIEARDTHFLPASFALWLHTLASTDGWNALQLSLDLVQHAAGQPFWEVVACMAVSYTYACMGYFEATLMYARRAQAIVASSEPPVDATYQFEEPLAVTMIVEGFALAHLGDFEAGRARLDAAVTRAEAGGRPNDIVVARLHRCWWYVWAQLPEQALLDLRAAKPILTADGMRYWDSLSEVCYGYVDGLLIDPVAGAARLKAGTTGYMELGGNMSREEHLVLLAKLLMHSRQYEDAWDVLESAIAISERHGGGMFAPEFYRQRAELLRLLGKVDEAERELQRALRAALEQRSRWMQLRICLSLARLWDGSPRSGEGCRRVGEALSHLTGGEWMPEVVTAHAWLQSHEALIRPLEEPGLGIVAAE